MPNAYEILHVAREADPDEIKRAYRKAALAYHPDRHPPSAKLVAEKSFKEVAQAYAILSDASRKRGYDRMLNLAESTFRPTPPPPPPPTTSTAIATRARRNSFSGYPVSVQPPTISVHAGEVDPHAIFSRAWAGLSPAQVFAQNLAPHEPSQSSPLSPLPSNPGSPASPWAPPRPSTPGPHGPRPPSRSSTPVAHQHRPQTAARATTRSSTPLTHEYRPSQPPPRASSRSSTPGPHELRSQQASRGPARSSTPGPYEHRPQPVPRSIPRSSTPGPSPSPTGYTIPRTSSAYGASPGTPLRPRPTPTFSQQSIYDDAVAAEKASNGRRPVAISIRATTVLGTPDGSVHTQRICLERSVDRDGVVRESFRRERAGVIMEPVSNSVPVRPGSRAGYEIPRGRPNCYTATADSGRRNSFSGSASYR